MRESPRTSSPTASGGWWPDGLLTRAHAGRGHRAEYSRTEAAIQLVPVMAALGRWGARHRPTTPSRRVRAKQPAGPIFGMTS
jgi:hypothetical protein